MGTLTIYRRHTKSCAMNYPQNYRLYRPMNKREMAKDCACPIVATGTLKNEQKRLQHVSLETEEWDVAERLKKQWEAWQATIDPTPSPVVLEPTVVQAVDAFFRMHGETGKAWEPETLAKFRVLLRIRLKMFCDDRKIDKLRVFDTSSVVDDFVTSWRNLNPARNKKLPGAIKQAGGWRLQVDGDGDGQPLGHMTKVKELERFRYFTEWCVTKGWLSENHAKRIKLEYAKPLPKRGFEPDQEARVFDATALVQDGGKRIGQYNARELEVFCMVARQAGLRVSDVTKLNESNIVKRAGGDGYVIYIERQKKTDSEVRVPITKELHEALMSLRFKGGEPGRRFWFWTGKSKPKTATKNWEARIRRLFKLAGVEHVGATHVFRHTFSISALNDSIDVKWVSRWLGHKSVATTEKHYAHAIHATNVASEQEYDQLIQRRQKQQQQRKRQSRRK